MSLRALVYAYVLGGITFLPLLICAAIAWTIYTSVPVGDPDASKLERKRLSDESKDDDEEDQASSVATNDLQRPKKGWLTVRRTFEERETDASYVAMMRTFLDSRSKDPKRSRPKDMWYVVLKGHVLYLYEDEAMTECEAAIQVSSHEVVVYPEGLLDGELFTKRNAICLKPIQSMNEKMSSVTKEMELEGEDVDKKLEEMDVSETKKRKAKEGLEDAERVKAEARNEAFDSSTPWFIFVRSCVEMEDWYLALVHGAKYPSCPSTLQPVEPVFRPLDMQHLVSTLDEQPDVIPMRWLNALIGRIFFSFYRTQTLESFIIGRLMKKLSKVKTPSFLQNIIVTEVSVGNTPPSFSKPMLKELTKEGDASLEIRLMYKGEIRVTVEATAIINLGQRFKTYTVKLVLAVVLRKLDGNLLVKVKRPPTNRIWYAFTQPPDMVLSVEPVVSDRQIKWSMILSSIESRLKEVINESVVLPNMDDVAFFESSRYEQRGGIWADAVRKERSVSEMLNGSAEPKAPAAASEATGIPKSLSVDAIQVSTSESPPETSEVRRAESIAAPESSEANKRKSWFSTTHSVGTESIGAMIDDGQESGSNHLKAPEIERGRSSNGDGSSRRATSVPASKTASNDPPGDALVKDELGDITNEAKADLLSMESAASSSASTSSTLPRLRSLSSGANVLGRDPEDISPQSRDSTISRTSTNTTTSSFLTALRSKADKQALSNTAKEAMRKWSTNWNNFKRDRNADSSNAEDSADSAPQGSPNIFSFPSKGRNYADIRSAVTGRKDIDSSPSSEERPEAGPSRPIDIPRRETETEESAGSPAKSASSLHKEQDAAPSTPPTQGSISPRTPSLLRKDGHRSHPSPPKVTTETHSFENASAAATPQTAPPFVPPPSPPIQAPPIKTQPSQAAVMTIPGIHASHRGEVMSMGYAPPAPSPPMTPEHKLRSPAIPPTIQNMYRLFKSPTASGSSLQQQQSTRVRTTSNSTANTEDSPRASGEAHKPSPEINEDVAPLSLTPTAPTISVEKASSPAAKPMPPPLPPRSLPRSSTTPSLSPYQSSSNSLDALSTGGSSNIPASSSSASEALKLIAEQDESKRKSFDAPAEAKPRSKRSSLGAKRIAPVSHSEDFVQDQQFETAAEADAQAPVPAGNEDNSKEEKQEQETTVLAPQFPAAGKDEDRTLTVSSEQLVQPSDPLEDQPQEAFHQENVSAKPIVEQTNQVDEASQIQPQRRPPPPLPPRKPSFTVQT